MHCTHIKDMLIWFFSIYVHYFHGEKAWRQLHKNAASNIEQFLETAPHKAAAIQPPTITKIRWTRHTGHCWRSRDELISDVLLWTPSHGREKAGQPARTYIERRRVPLKTCRKRWTIGRGGERGSEISVLIARQDDDDDDFFNMKFKINEKSQEDPLLKLEDKNSRKCFNFYDFVKENYLNNILTWIYILPRE